ncbi:hypothetical protein OG21DRAFT_1523996 [Imleria badia]|nr:hypothetical protein OG21DRAFT_1523996 [Imleria badia]
MKGPESGKYLIHLADGPRIGVDYGNAPVKPVIVDGENKIWTVRKVEEEKYTMTLDDGGPVYIQDMEGSLVGTDKEPPFIWAIREREAGLYTIEVPRGIIETKGWTVEHIGPRKPVRTVTLDIIFLIPGPRRNQLWRLIPLEDD